MNGRVQAFYQNPAVRARMLEYLGGTALEDVTSVYLSRCDVPNPCDADMKAPRELDFFLERGWDVARSLWDREGLICHLDIEYTNLDFQAEAYFHPRRAFAIQEPVAQAVEVLLLDHGIAPLHLLTGRGHHFVWRVPRNSGAFTSLQELGRVGASLQQRYAVAQPPVMEAVEFELGAAFAGLGMVMEWVAQRAKQEAGPRCALPIELTEVAVGPQQCGRELISIDVSEYGDPLHTRCVRMPFSAYRKPWEKDGHPPCEAEPGFSLMMVLPLHEMTVDQALLVRQDLREVAELARRAPGWIPDQGKATERLIDTYHHSGLAVSHRHFYEQEQELPHNWTASYDRMPQADLPPCVRHILRYPNPLLLKPAGIRLVAQVLLATGWHPRHIAGLVRSKFERDFGWGPEWYVYDASTRAEFYVRLFTGMMDTRVDGLVDLNCRSTQEKCFCFDADGSCNLAPYRESLLQRSHP